jgi:catechol 2,3-dioxygenase-like lactoylglutathione lyase family enzyme
MKMKLFIPLFVFGVFYQINIYGQIQPSASVIKGINHISLSVVDLENSIEFYTKQIGLLLDSRYEISKPLAVEKSANIQHTNRKVAWLKGPNGQVELVQFENTKPNARSDMPVQGPGITHICYQSPATNSIYAKAKTDNATVISRGNLPVNRGFGFHYAYIREHNNIMFEIEEVEKPKFKGDLVVAHVALVTHDIDRLVDFYTKLTGQAPKNRIDNIKNNPKLDDIANIDSLKLRGAWFRLDNMLLEIWQFDNPKTIPSSFPESYTKIGYQKIAFEIENLAMEYKKLEGKGIVFLSKPVSKKGLTEVFLRDPDGNLLLLQSFKEKNNHSVSTLNKLD